MADPKSIDKKPGEKPETTEATDGQPQDNASGGAARPTGEMGGRGGLDPTRYGDWEIGGRCVDF